MAGKTAKKRVYIETSVISYLTARASFDILRLARQQLTIKWWEKRDQYDLFVSQTVMKEIQCGDVEVARARVARVVGVPVLADHIEVDNLADYLVADKVVPAKVRTDALHIAFATYYAMDYLLTWNQSHIVNLAYMDAIHAAIERRGFQPPRFVKPSDLLEGDYAY